MKPDPGKSPKSQYHQIDPMMFASSNNSSGFSFRTIRYGLSALILLIGFMVSVTKAMKNSAHNPNRANSSNEAEVLPGAQTVPGPGLGNGVMGGQPISSSTAPDPGNWRPSKGTVAQQTPPQLTTPEKLWTWYAASPDSSRDWLMNHQIAIQGIVDHVGLNGEGDDDVAFRVSLSDGTSAKIEAWFSARFADQLNPIHSGDTVVVLANAFGFGPNILKFTSESAKLVQVAPDTSAPVDPSPSAAPPQQNNPAPQDNPPPQGSPQSTGDSTSGQTQPGTTAGSTTTGT